MMCPEGFPEWKIHLHGFVAAYSLTTKRLIFSKNADLWLPPLFISDSDPNVSELSWNWNCMHVSRSLVLERREPDFPSKFGVYFGGVLNQVNQWNQDVQINGFLTSIRILMLHLLQDCFDFAPVTILGFDDVTKPESFSEIHMV